MGSNDRLVRMLTVVGGVLGAFFVVFQLQPLAGPFFWPILVITAIIGIFALSSGGGFRWEAIGNQGIDFLYTGTYTLSADGGMTIT